MACRPADEADFLELLIASERIQEWMDSIQACKAPDAHLVGVLEAMLKALESAEAYVEEAREAGAAAILTRMLKRLDPENINEALVELVARMLAVLSGPAASGGGVRGITLAVGGSDEGAPRTVTVSLYEGSLGDGVGARLWAAAHTLCRQLSQSPDLVAGRRVLELGAGCGACGLVAARLGAKHVVLTDYLDSVLRCLGASVALTLGAADGPAPKPQWAAGPVAVRRLDWNDYVEGNEAEPAATAARSTNGGDCTSGVPCMDAGAEPFEVILAADVLYESWMAAAVAATTHRWLAPGGVALVSCAVRNAAIFEAFERELEARGLRWQRHPVEPDGAFVGVHGHARDYEGGFCLMVVDRSEAQWTGDPPRVAWV